MLSTKQIGLVLLFTIVETIGLTVWLYVLFPSLITSMNGAIAVIALFGFLLLEHTIATITGLFPLKGQVHEQDE